MFSEKSEGCVLLGGIMLFVACVLLAGGCSVYQASVQSAVYQREGIEISTWEVLMGAKPAERAVRIKE